MLAIALSLTSCCGYRLGSGDLSDAYHTISIPYICGDMTGLFTASLIREIGNSSPFRYVNSGGDLLLCIRLIGQRDENVGFRYDIEKSGALANWLVPTETRLWAAAEITVIEAASSMPLVGPVRVATYVDFDHEYYLSQNGVNVFSLGQLTDIREATEAAQTPLSRALAQKIVDYISNVW
jgi:hypothetical protein